jgi:hypothetical protein
VVALRRLPPGASLVSGGRDEPVTFAPAAVLAAVFVAVFGAFFGAGVSAAFAAVF